MLHMLVYIIIMPDTILCRHHTNTHKMTGQTKMTITTAKIMPTISNSSSAAIRSEIVMNAIIIYIGHYIIYVCTQIGLKIVDATATVTVGWRESSEL